jgi:ADP-heptose:LPS heptosyltransferase
MTIDEPQPGMPSILLYFDSLLVGDSMLMLPILRALRRAQPKAKIVLMCGRGTTFLARQGRTLCAGVVDEFIENESWDGIFPSPWHPGAIDRLAGRAFDIIIDTQSRFMTTLALKRVPHDIFVARARGVLLSNRLPIYFAPKGPNYGSRLAKLCERALGQRIVPVLDWQLPEHLRREAAAMLSIPASAQALGIAPGASVVEKRWPIDRFVELAHRQASRGRHLVFVLGPAELDLRQRLLAEFPRADFPQCAHEPLLTLAVAERMTVTVASDGGAGHLIAATSPRHVTVFARAKPSTWAPWARELKMVTPQDCGVDSILEIGTACVERQVDDFFQQAGDNSAGNAGHGR